MRGSQQALRIAAIYLLIGLTWIAASDYAVERAFEGTGLLTRAQNIKGYAFVSVTAFLLFLLVRRELAVLREARERLAAANAQLSRLAAFPQFSPHPVVSVAPSGSIGYANQAAEDLAAVIGVESVRELLPDCLPGVVQQCLGGDNDCPQVDHALNDHLLRWSFFPHPGGEAVYGFGRDTTEEARVTARLIEAEKLQAVGRLTAGVAHDFNNLLMVVSLGARVIEEDEEATGTIKEHTAAMRAAADQAAALVKRLLAFGRPQPPEVGHVDLNHEVRAFTSFARHVATAGTPVTVHTGDEPLTVRADPGQLNQLLMNLVVNAADAVDEDGEIEIAVEPAMLRNRPAAEIRVRDTGRGIPEQVLPRILEPFFTTKADRGTGLGLSVVHDIVVGLGGEMEVESVEKVGTTFRILLPQATAAREAAAGASP